MPSTPRFKQKFDLSYSPVDTHAVSITNGAGLRIYSDTRPRNWKIADLQKGLILVYNGREVVGEGAGFGLPVVVCSDETYFSGSSKVCVSEHENGWIIRKEFMIDRVARNRFRSVTLENRKARVFLTLLADLYQRHPRFRFLALKNLTRKMRVDTVFVKSAPMGEIAVSYAFDKQRVLVKADFRCLKRRRLQKIFMLNEQGSLFFRKYVDSEGTELTDGRMGAWDGIDAEWACLKPLKGHFGFRLWRVKDSILRRGREFLEGSLDWAGLDYEVNPKNSVFEYAIDILGA